MAAGEGGEHQLASVRMAGVDGQLVAVFHRFHDALHVGEVEARIDALGVEVQRQGHEVDVARALPIAEEATLDTVGAGHHGQLRSGDPGTAVVVRMHRDHHAVAARDVAAHPLDLVGVDVGAGRLHRGGQVQDHRFLRRGLQHLEHPLADLQAEIQFGRGEGFGAVLETPVRAGATLRLLAQQARALDGQRLHARPVEPEHDLAPGGRDGVVEVDGGRPRAGEALETALDQVMPGLGEHLDHDILRHAALADQAADEIELGRPRGREPDLDLLHADLHQEVEEALLLFGVHRIGEGLVAVAQVGGEPPGRLGDGPGRPLAVRQVDLCKGAVLGRRVAQHRGVSSRERRRSGRKAGAPPPEQPLKSGGHS